MELELFTALCTAAVAMAVPLLFAGLGELLAEKSGVINIGLEGMILLGAFAAFAVAHATGSNAAGLAAALALGGVWGLGFAYFAVVRGANQIVVGTAVNLFATGLTGVLYRSIYGVTGTAMTIEPSPTIALPGARSIPILGQALLNQTPLTYVCLATIPLMALFLARTRAGLELKMVGENPNAAATHGINVARTRTSALVACGIFCAAGGAYLTLDYTHTFVEGMSSGRGFIALAIVIVGRRRPAGVLVAALLFGFVTALQFHFQALALGIPFQFFLVLPYVATLALLALNAGDTNAPAALGKN